MPKPRRSLRPTRFETHLGILFFELRLNALTIEPNFLPFPNFLLPLTDFYPTLTWNLEYLFLYCTTFNPK
jgi:hypothetical protein